MTWWKCVMRKASCTCTRTTSARSLIEMRADYGVDSCSRRGWRDSPRRVQYTSTPFNEEDTAMTKLYTYAGIAASVVLIAFGIGSVITGFNGRDRVQTDLAREQI